MCDCACMCAIVHVYVHMRARAYECAYCANVHTYANAHERVCEFVYECACVMCPRGESARARSTRVRNMELCSYVYLHSHRESTCAHPHSYTTVHTLMNARMLACARAYAVSTGGVLTCATLI